MPRRSIFESLQVLIHRAHKDNEPIGEGNGSASPKKKKHKFLQPGTRRLSRYQLASKIAARNNAQNSEAESEHRANERSLAQSTNTIKTFTGVLAAVGFASAVVSGFQWWEIHSGGVDTHELAESTKKLAEAAKSQAAAAKDQVTAIQGQLSEMRDEQRPWVGPFRIYLADPSNNEEPLKVIVEYRNFGRTPAMHVQHHGGVTLPPISIQSAIPQLQFWKNKEEFNPSALCWADKNSTSDSTAYPSDVSYATDVGIEKNTVLTNRINNVPIPIDGFLSQILTNKNLYVVFGCFTYRTFDTTFYKTWCAFLNPDKGEAPISKRQFMFCPYGNEESVKAN